MRKNWLPPVWGGPLFAIDSVPVKCFRAPSRSSGPCHASAGRVTIRTREPHRYTLDGDLFPGTRDLTLEAGPVLRFLRA